MGATVIYLLVPLAPLVGLWIALSFAVWPFANCRRCDGKGRWRNPNPPSFREGRFGRYMYCSVCRGTGRRLYRGGR